MPVYTSLKKEDQFNCLSVLTLGNFDGVHLGHKAILKRVVELSNFHHFSPSVITFKNHPSALFKPNHVVSLLTSPEHKVKLLEETGVERIFMLEFDQQFANQSAEEFLTHVMNVNPFRYLVLGYDAKIGKDRQGDGELIHSLSKKMHFIVEYLAPYAVDTGEIVSSSLIRKCVQENDLKKAEKLLGRPYSILAPVSPGLGKGKRIGFPTANVEIAALCHPAFGVYAVTVVLGEKRFPGVANLGFAPTVRSDHKPLLEVHLFDMNENIYGQYVEVIFHELIRPEKRFEDIENLKKQITEDIGCAKKLLNYEN